MRLEHKQLRMGTLVLTLLALLAFYGRTDAQAAVRDYEVRAGTLIKLSMDNYLTSRSAKIGDPFTATVTEDVRAASGEVVIPRNTKVEGRVSAVTPAQRSSKSGTLSVDFVRLKLANGRTYEVEGQLTSLDAREKEQIDEENRVSGGSSTKRNVVFIGGGAAGGAAIGAIAGGGKGAGIGAGVGAVAGILGSVFSKGEEAEVQTGQRFGMELLRPVYIQDNFGGDDRRGDNRGDGRSDDRRGDNRGDGRNGDGRGDNRGDNRRDDRRGDDRYDNRRPTRPAASLTSQAMIRRAQGSLRDLGYFKGTVNGTVSPSTKQAVRAFQRDYDLEQTGDLDIDTAYKLGLVNEDGIEIIPMRINKPDARRQQDGSIRVTGEAEANGGGWELLTDAQPNGEELRVYVKGIPPETGTQAITRYPLDFNVANARGVKKVIFFGEGKPITLELANPGVELTHRLKDQAQTLLDTYKEVSGVGRRGSTELNVSRLTEAQAQILAALNNLNSTSLFVDQLFTVGAADAGLKGSLTSLLREARQSRRLLERLNEQRLDRQWGEFDRNLRQVMELYRLNYDTQDRNDQ